VKASCSMFSQILKLIPRSDFQCRVTETGAERGSKGLSSWSQFGAMMFCQLGRANTLREIEGGLKSCEGKVKHLGITVAKRSSLSYANSHRPSELFEKVFGDLFDTVAAKVAEKSGGKRKFRFKNKLVSLDSTTIELCASMYDWAHYMRTKGAVKLHLVLDHDGYLPCFGVITNGKGADVHVAHTLEFAPGTIVVDDRGYNDYSLFGKWTREKVFFVTREVRGAQYEVVEPRKLPKEPAILADEIIQLTGKGAWEKCPHRLRRIEVVREDTGDVMVFLTNHLELSARTIADIYKDRWKIELFFKALKQNFKIKTFVGTSANAVKTQIWTALIAIMLVRYLQLVSRLGWSLSHLVVLLRMNLFTHKDLWAWVDEPYASPPDEIDDAQAPLAFA
jgi:hypothetical protein